MSEENRGYRDTLVDNLRARVEELEQELEDAKEGRLYWNNRYAKEARRMKASQERVGVLTDAINEVYPTIAERAIQLQHGGETTAFKAWNHIAVTLHTALSATSTPAGIEQTVCPECKKDGLYRECNGCGWSAEGSVTPSPEEKNND